MEYIREALNSILEEENKKEIDAELYDDWIQEDEEDGFNNELSFNDFLNEAEIILVDNAFDFDINEWEKENQEEIDEELSEDTNNKTGTTTSQFIKYQLTPDKVKEIVNKIINSEFNIINYWKTNQFKKKNNLTDDDLKDILKTLTEQDYKTNSISIDNSKNEAIIFIKQTNIKNLNNIKVYIKLDYDSIENSPVIVLSFHGKRQKTQLTSSYKNTDNLKEDIKDEDNYLSKLDLKSNGIYSLNTGWVKHPVQQDIPDINMEKFEKEFKIWEDKYFDLLDKESSREEIDNLIEDIYNLRKEGMEEEGEYSIKNLIFKEFRNLGYLDNLKELRKEEVSKELSLESLKEELIDYSNEDEINYKTKEIIDIISQELKEPFVKYTSLDYLSFGGVIKGCDYRDLVKLVVPYIVLNDTDYSVYFTDSLGWEDEDYIITRKETTLKDLYKAFKQSWEEQEEALSKEEFEDHLFTIDEDGNYINVKLN